MEPGDSPTDPVPLTPPDHNDFVANDGNVTVVAVRGSVDEDPKPEADQDPARGDGSDSGVELNGQDRTEPENTPLDTPTRDQHHLLLDYDGNSEGGSESSTSVFSARPGPSPGPGPVPTPRRKVAAAGSSRCSAPSTAATATPTARERWAGAGGRGASCSRAGRASGESASCRTPQRGSSLVRAQRPSNIMSSSMTSSLIGSLCNGGRGASATRGTTSTPKTTPRGTRGSAATAACRDDGRWPFTVQRAASVSRSRASSGHAALTSSSSRNSVNSNTASTPSPTVESKSEKFATLPRRRRRRSVESPGMDKSSASQTVARKLKITLYHETAAQTALTCQDIEDALGGKSCRFRPIDAVEQVDQDVQVDLEVEEINSQVLNARLISILDMLGIESLPYQAAHSVGNSGTPSRLVDHLAWIKSLDLLEANASAIQQRDLHQKNEMLRLKSELDHMSSQQKETEAESAELQEFLQYEKKTLSESLKDAELEMQEQKASMSRLQMELERQREECQHLVRMSEQQRQEILTLEARVAGQELRSREALLQQGAAVSGAAVALCALSSRLDNLATKLENSTLNGVLSAITTDAEAVVATGTKEVLRPQSANFENLYQTLDNVTEPVLDDDGGHRDSTHLDTDTTRLANSESIQNLSAAILNRRLQEEANDSYSSVSEDAPVHLVDQVLDVDSSVTRLLQALQQAMKSSDLSAVKIEDISQSHIGIKKLSTDDQSQSYNQKDKSQTYTSLLNSVSDEFCNKGGNNPVSNGIIELTFTSERATGAS